MKHNIWTTIKPTITESCLLVTMIEIKRYEFDEYTVYELIYDDGDIIAIQDGSDYRYSDLKASQYLTLKLAP